MALPFFLRKGTTVANRAVNGRSSKSFVDEGRLDAIQPRDLFLIQFAHNDEKSDDPTRYTEPWTTYQDHLRLYIDGARTRGARLVVRELIRTRVLGRPPASGKGEPHHVRTEMA